MVIYCILNPDAKFPFYLDAKRAREQLSGPGRCDVLKLLDDKLRNKQKPLHSSKYANLRQMEKLKILSEIYEGCTTFDPLQRLTASKVVKLLACLDDHLDVFPLTVSQNSAMEKYDMLVAVDRVVDDDQLLENAVNACSFISIVLGDLILSQGDIAEADLKQIIISHAEHAITDIPRHFNPYRDSEQLYDAQEAYNILRRADVITKDYELTEEVLTSHCAFSDDGKQLFLSAMKKCKTLNIKYLLLFIRLASTCY